MLDIPYYLSREHNPKMLAAVIKEANRIYRLWCANNPGFAEHGRVHLIAHSLGSVMSIDVLSHQPTYVPPSLGEPTTPIADLPTDHFLFNTHNLYVCGSPSGLFLLLKKASLLPRQDTQKPRPDAEDLGSIPAGVAGDRDDYGCLAVHNIYNIINPYDPVAYALNATVDTAYAAALKPATVPTASSGWFVNPFRSGASGAGTSVTPLPPLPSNAGASTSVSSSSVPLLGAHMRLPSNVELETHNFTREALAERRAYLLNDNGQIDWFLRWGGGPLDIQYLTMLGAHSSYWVSRDFVRMVVVEVGRRPGREGTVGSMRAVKKKRRGVGGGA